MKRWSVIFAVAVILLANAIALIGVARNRAGGPVATIELTERELPLQDMGLDNSLVVLRLAWSEPAAQTSETVLDRAKLEEIGFDLPDPGGTQSTDIALPARVAYVALEYDGNAWEKWLKQAEEEKQKISSPNQRSSFYPNASGEPIHQSHLCPVDASKSWAELRKRYPDQTKHLIVRAVLAARLNNEKDPATGKVIARNAYGFVADILPSTIYVPLPHARLISSLKPQAGKEPRYIVTLKYGSHLEPWVAAIKIR